MELQGSFDTWTSVFLVVSAVGTFLSLLLLTDANGRKNNWPIALLTLSFSLILISYVFFWTGHIKDFPYLNFYPQSFYLAFGPLLYAYVLKMFRPSQRFNYWHLAPAVLVFGMSGYYSIVTREFSQMEAYQDDPLLKIHWSLRSAWVSAVSFLAYLWICRDIIRNTSKSEPPTEGQLLRERWSRFLMRLFAVFIIAYVGYFVLVGYPFFDPLWDYSISIVMSIGIYGIGYMVYTEPRLFNGEFFSRLFIKKPSANGLTESTKEEFYNALVAHIETEKPYMDHRLRLVTLADQMGFSSHLLSQLINEKAKKNFNRFINEFRIKEAESLLLDSGSHPIERVYFDVGFNSKATFYNAFKRKHGCTPSEYVRAKGKG